MHHHDPWAGQSHSQSGSFLLNHLWVTAPKQRVSIPKTNEFTLFWIAPHSTLEISPLSFIFVNILHNAWEVSHHWGPSTLVPSSSAIPQESGFGIGHVACSVGVLVTADVAARDMGRSRRGRSNWNGNNLGNVGKRPLQGCSQSLSFWGTATQGGSDHPRDRNARGRSGDPMGQHRLCSPPLLRCKTNILHLDASSSV